MFFHKFAYIHVYFSGIVKGITTASSSQVDAMTSKPVTTEAATSKVVTSEAMTSEPMTSKAMTSEDMTSKAMTSEAMTSLPLTSATMTSEIAIDSDAVTSDDITLEAKTTKSMTQEDITLQTITSEISTSKAIILDALTSEIPPANTKPTTITYDLPSTIIPNLNTVSNTPTDDGFDSSDLGEVTLVSSSLTSINQKGTTSSTPIPPLNKSHDVSSVINHIITVLTKSRNLSDRELMWPKQVPLIQRTFSEYSRAFQRIGLP